MNFKLLCVITLGILINMLGLSVHALDSDREQPATLDADDFELDLKTGVRTYRGNVVLRQGSIRLDCDELVTYFSEDGELDKGICTGNPGKFKQRPEGQDSDVVGQALTITLDQVKEIIILKNRADVEQAGNRIKGKLITYDLKSEKVKVTGSTSTSKTASTAAGETGSTESAEGSDSAGAESTRPRLIIQPRKKKEN
jgi:lipopolysaccharide export system protein LptA